MILLDTSVLIDALTGGRRSAPALRRAIESGERIALTTLVLYEWQRGSRRADELAAQEAQGREIDLAIAACAIRWNATLWTLHVRDFRDVPGLTCLRRDSLARGLC